MENAFESRPRIFVVDDEPEIAKMLAVVLQLNLYDAVPYCDPAEALAAAKEAAPDYLISDVLMPGMDGIELGIAVRTVCPDCKVLLFSGQVEAPVQVQAAKDKGYDFGFLHKPVHPKVLVETLQGMDPNYVAEGVGVESGGSH